MFKNWTWKQWTALGVVAAIIIAAVVCHLVQPTVSYAYMEVVAVITFGLGVLTGCLFTKNGAAKDDSKQLLTD